MQVQVQVLDLALESVWGQVFNGKNNDDFNKA